MQTKKELFWEIARFLLVGATATLADYATFYLFRRWFLPAALFSGAFWDVCSLIIATAFGFLVGLLVNWVFSVRFVFRSTKDKIGVSDKKPFAIFTLIGLIGLGITELGMALLVAIVPEITLFGVTRFLLPWDEWLAKVVMTCIVLVFNYVCRKAFIFKT